MGVPLYRLLGGRFRDRIPMVWTIGIRPAAEMAEEARGAVRRGFGHLKLKIGSLGVEADVENVAAVRRAVGPSVGIRVDANASLDLNTALALLKELAPQRLELIEQPLAIDDLDGMARLIALTGACIMPDESLHSPESALIIVARKAASVFGMKLAKHGGLHNARKVAAIAQAAHLPVYPGNQPSTSIGSATAAHFYAATWNASLAGDFNVGPMGWLADDIVKVPLAVEAGAALVPELPGIGVELDERKLARYAREPEPRARLPALSTSSSDRATQRGPL
jgi:muconate cycloisomerase